MQDLKGMKLHEVRSVNVNGEPVKVIKVPGGWIYRIGSPENFTTTFVPATPLALQDIKSDNTDLIEFDDNVDDNNITGENEKGDNNKKPSATGLAGSTFGTI